MPLSILVFLNTKQWTIFPLLTFITSFITVLSYCVRLVVEMFLSDAETIYEQNLHL